MSKVFKKEVYTLEEIGEMILKKCPNRFKNLNSAYASAKIVANRLGIEDINGKKRNKLIAARDAERILAELQDMKKGRRKKAEKTVLNTEPTPVEGSSEQVSLFDEGIIDWLEPYTPHVFTKKEKAACADEVGEIPMSETVTPKEVDPRELFEAGVDLMRAINRFAEVIGMARRNETNG